MDNHKGIIAVSLMMLYVALAHRFVIHNGVNPPPTNQD
jgi:hypothetical protein